MPPRYQSRIASFWINHSTFNTGLFRRGEACFARVVPPILSPRPLLYPVFLQETPLRTRPCSGGTGASTKSKLHPRLPPYSYLPRKHRFAHDLVAGALFAAICQLLPRPPYPHHTRVHCRFPCFCRACRYAGDIVAARTAMNVKATLPWAKLVTVRLPRLVPKDQGAAPLLCAAFRTVSVRNCLHGSPAAPAISAGPRAFARHADPHAALQRRERQ